MKREYQIMRELGYTPFGSVLFMIIGKIFSPIIIKKLEKKQRKNITYEEK